VLQWTALWENKLSVDLLPEKPPGCKIKSPGLLCIYVGRLLRKLGGILKPVCRPPHTAGPVRRRRINTPFNYCSFFSLPLLSTRRPGRETKALQRRNNHRRPCSRIKVNAGGNCLFFCLMRRKRASQFRSLIPFFTANIFSLMHKSSSCYCSGNSLNSSKCYFNTFQSPWICQGDNMYTESMAASKMLVPLARLNKFRWLKDERRAVT